MDLENLLEEIKKELQLSSENKYELNDEIKFQSPIDSSLYKNIGDFGVVNSTHEDGHKGIDMGAPKGTPIKPILPGEVSKTGQDPKGGNYVVVNHKYKNDIYRSYYAHLDTINCKAGDQLNPNSILGIVGETGNAKGRAYHLHLQVWKNNQLINPATLFPFKSYKK